MGVREGQAVHREPDVVWTRFLTLAVTRFIDPADGILGPWGPVAGAVALVLAAVLLGPLVGGIARKVRRRFGPGAS
jgi:hypothetical protein